MKRDRDSLVRLIAFALLLNAAFLGMRCSSSSDSQIAEADSPELLARVDALEAASPKLAVRLKILEAGLAKAQSIELKFAKVDSVSQQQRGRIIDNEKDIKILKAELDETRKELIALRRSAFKKRTETPAGSTVLEANSIGSRNKQAKPPVLAKTETDCVEFIALLSAAEVGKDLGKTEDWVLRNYQVRLWEKHSSKGKGRPVGKMFAGSHARLIRREGDDYFVQSPLDKSKGWVSGIQVSRTIKKNPITLELCK